jgi:hypothetical protein
MPASAATWPAAPPPNRGRHSLRPIWATTRRKNPSCCVEYVRQGERLNDTARETGSGIQSCRRTRAPPIFIRLREVARECSSDERLEIMSRNVIRSILMLGSITAVVVAAWTVAPLALGKSDQDPGCTLVGPEEPLEMNTVLISDVRAKTVAMEKEVIACSDASFIIDMETFIEIIQQGSKVVAKRVEVTQCFKELRPVLRQGTVRCSRPRSVPIGPVDPAPLRECKALPSPSDPVEMNTVTLGSLVKTVKVDKENFLCGGTIFVKDLYLFTEIIERVSRSGVKPIIKRYEGIVCTKNVSDFVLERCNPFPTT